MKTKQELITERETLKAEMKKYRPGCVKIEMLQIKLNDVEGEILANRLNGNW